MGSLIKIHLFLVFQMSQLWLTQQNYCLQAVKSKKAVETCPTSKEEWDSAARKKNCEELALNQSCTTPDNFKYHCVINSYRNETVEVCAPSRLILGHCTEFNDKGGIIQLQRRAPCNNSGFPKCTSYYKSTEAYKFQDCYMLVRKTHIMQPTFGGIKISSSAESIEKPTSAKPEETENGISAKYIILIPLTILALLVGILLIVYKLKRKGESSEDLEKEPLMGLKTDQWRKQKKENKEESKRYLKDNKKLDKYYVETEAYRSGEDIFHKYGIVIWTGPPGCGKTKAAIHLILKEMNHEDTNCTFRMIRFFEELYENKNCTFRMIRFFKELSYIEPNEKTLILIDNIFFQQLMDSVQNWWDALERLHKNYFQNNETESGKRRVRVIITARENVIERACHLMDKTTPILNENFRINANFLTEDEKDKIFSKQCEFANVDRNLVFTDGILKEANGPIGFPLCAHLFACSDEYQKSGSKFFSHPIEYLKRKIDEEIQMDTSHQRKLLFLVLFFHEWQTKLGTSEKLEIKNDRKCQQILEKYAKDLVKNFKQCELIGLENEAQRFIGSFLKEETNGSYKFVHDSVYEAVGAFLCEKYVTETAQYFPLDILQNQDFKTATKNERVILATRLISEACDKNFSKVFACRLFRQRSFTECFLSELNKFDDKKIKDFFKDVNKSSPVELPCLFWTSFNKLAFLTENLYNIVCKENINPDYQLYVLLYGECCAGNEHLLVMVDWMLHWNLEEIKRRVLNFGQNEEMCILHLVISSEKSDTFASAVVEKLLNDGLRVDVRTKRKFTPLMLAVNHRMQRKQVVHTLIKRSPKLNCKDRENSNVFHHCLKSCSDDETCATYLIIFLKLEDAKACLLQNNVDGNIPLSVAAMEARHSRIHSILLLLENGLKHKTETLNKDGYSPLHLSVCSLKENSAYMELECCIRVVIFLLYGDSPDNQSDTDFKAIEECQYDLVKSILRTPKDQKNMEYVIESIFTKLDEKQTAGNFENLPMPSITMNKAIQTGIYRSIHLLKNYRFDRTT